MSPTQTRSRTPAVDPACAEAVDLARSAAVEISRPEYVGEHLALRAEGDRVVTHYFDCADPGYQGWRFAVTVARAARAKVVTVSESVLLPGTDALLAPEWVPWKERLRPGDLGVGDLLPTPEDDDRLAPGFTQVPQDDPDPLRAALAADAPDRQMLWELGLGRPRVLSAIGRDEAAHRWYTSDAGPDSPIADSAPGHCADCGFMVPLAGGLRQLFGVCANAFAPDDGKVVSLDHGCGAHSEAVLPAVATEPPPPIVDELGYDIIPAGQATDEPPAEKPDGD
ncbi:DUF3027 domain-containing protein [Allonocardiopsis opalescens]|uniref:DUF3027 family protein n=1 Tax=Allonocardiopsis opalescens TaxID=1144618 RepID=A0A2T0Q9U5_9ACTN|nr:DUF3027 domain-containing protein [Allonocardiopsis opalescens]PRY00666.1 Protein of unknown function (DUF3027) [Allonocardiopsis opalescens]